ncbi:hypothetical protein Tco_1253145 [Tanacetum coccineum]
MATNEETNAAGTDTRPPMLVENDYESWKMNGFVYSGLPDTSSTYSIRQALQRRFGIMWNCLCKDQDYQLEIPTLQMNTKFVNILPHIGVAHTTSAPVLSSPLNPSPQPTTQSPNEALMATMTQIANLLSGFQKQFPPTNNQLGFFQLQTHATVHDGGEGHVARQCKEQKRKMDSQYFKDKALLMEAKEKGDVLDAEEAEASSADTVDERPQNAAVAPMATCHPPVPPLTAKSMRKCPGSTFRLDAETEIDVIDAVFIQYLLDTDSPKCSN